MEAAVTYADDKTRIAEKWSQGDAAAFVAIHAAMTEFEGAQSAGRISGLTPRQKDALDFITVFIGQNGFSPSMEEIRIAIGLSSKSGVSRLLTGLEERGCIRRLPDRARGIALT